MQRLGHDHSNGDKHAHRLLRCNLELSTVRIGRGFEDDRPAAAAKPAGPNVDGATPTMNLVDEIRLSNHSHWQPPSSHRQRGAREKAREGLTVWLPSTLVGSSGSSDRRIERLMWQRSETTHPASPSLRNVAVLTEIPVHSGLGLRTGGFIQSPLRICTREWFARDSKFHAQKRISLTALPATVGSFPSDRRSPDAQALRPARPPGGRRADRCRLRREQQLEQHAAPSTAAPAPTALSSGGTALDGTVGPGFTITLTKGGQPVTTLLPPARTSSRSTTRPASTTSTWPAPASTSRPPSTSWARSRSRSR